MSCKIMLVDDDLQFRKTVKRSLEMNDYDVIEAENGSEAIDILMMQKVDLILSDVRMPKLNGIELLHRIKREKPETPFIMMTGFSEIIEIKEAYEIGADGFLSKPYNENDLVFQVEKALNQVDLQVNTNNKYIGVAVEEFVAGAKIQYPIYIKLEDDSFIKVANLGEDLNSSQVKTFKEKGIDRLYLTVNDFLMYFDFNLAILGSILRSERIVDDKKLKFFKILLHQITSFVATDGVSEEVLTRAHAIYEKLEKFIRQGDKNLLFKLPESFSSKDNNYDLTAISVCILSYIVHKIDWISQGSKQEAYIASLLQNMNDHHSENKEHPYLAYEQLESNELISSEISEIVLHHHEFIDGSGYPSGLNASQINPIGNLVGLSYDLAKLLKEHNYSFEKAIMSLLQTSSSLYKTEFISILDMMVFDFKKASEEAS